MKKGTIAISGNRESSQSATVAITAVIVLAACAFLLVGLAMGIAMAGGLGGWNMQDHMAGMMNRAGNSPQTPVVASQPEVSVEIRDFDFSPRDLTIDVGATVTWLNRDGAPHDATQDDGAWKTDLLQKNDSDSITFDEPGGFPYHCSVHPNMKGTVTVRGR